MVTGSIGSEKVQGRDSVRMYLYAVQHGQLQRPNAFRPNHFFLSIRHCVDVTVTVRVSLDAVITNRLQ